MTLKRFIDKRAGNPNCTIGYSAISQRHLVFIPLMEEDLATHVKALADQFHGLSLNKYCELAFEFAKANNLKIQTNWDKDKKKL